MLMLTYIKLDQRNNDDPIRFKSAHMSIYLEIDKKDNVAVALKPIEAGIVLHTSCGDITLKESIGQGHKFALKDINKNNQVIKYGYSIGHAIAKIQKGSLVHSHNLKTNLTTVLEYKYNKKKPCETVKSDLELSFNGYRRADGSVGIRNEIWIINTVGCVNKVAERITKLANEKFPDRCCGFYTFSHPYGCSQLGEDLLYTQKILSNLVKHPNAGAVLVLGLGCENNNIKEFKKNLGPVDNKRVRFLESQSVDDEIERALLILNELSHYIKNDYREICPLKDLIIGLKCGGSDGLSGISANPLLGTISNKIIDNGGSSILTEVPEMFGAETELMNRAANEEIFIKIVNLINNFKSYFLKYNQVVYENPSPGNKDGGITTLEDKALGCTRKGGDREVSAVLDYGEKVKRPGLNLLNGPGNDMVALTNLAAAGAQIVLFTTGRGTPLGGPVPTVKVSSNTFLAENKKNWIDFNAGIVTEGTSMNKLSDNFMEYILNVASGKKTCNELNDYREIAIFKDGVTL